jgi:hypothetical protein
MSVPRAMKPARGMSFVGLTDSSAASGSSSMPRKNHIANGRAKRMGTTPWGRKADWPGSGAILKSDAASNLPEKRAIAENTRRIAIEMIETTMANLNEMLAPAELRAMKIT